jgi:hypothetical protein
MKLITLLLVALISVGAYYYFLKNAAPAPGEVATQAISTTGVEMDLTSMAQAERMYFAQNGSYGTLDQLTSSGTMNLTRTGRDGYSYSVTTSPGGFTITATHPDVPVPAGTNGAAPLHYPTLSIDQTMQVRRSD